MKSILVFITFLSSLLAVGQEQGKPVDYTNPQKGDYIPLDHILTWSCQLDVRPDDARSLDEILDSLKLLPNWIFQFEVHTDCRASVEYNERSSQRRADTFRNYLVSKGFPAWRMKAKGMGESCLLLSKCSCDMTDPGNRVCSEREHQLNRRSLIRLLDTVSLIGSEPVNPDYPIPGQFRKFYKRILLMEFELGSEKDVTLWGVSEFIDSFPDTYFTIHVLNGERSIKNLSRSYRKRNFREVENLKARDRMPSRINIINHKAGSKAFKGMTEGYVVVIDSFFQKKKLMKQFGIQGDSNILVFDYSYTFKKKPTWEPVDIGGLQLEQNALKTGTYTLYLIETGVNTKMNMYVFGNKWVAFPKPMSVYETWEYINGKKPSNPTYSRIKAVKKINCPDCAFVPRMVLVRN